MLGHTFALTGRLPDLVATELSLLPLLEPNPNASCCSATTIPVAVLYTAPVANLLDAPRSVDGYMIRSGDVVGLAAQTTTAQNKLYTATVAGGGAVSLVELSVQPPDGALLRVVRGNLYLDSLWCFTTGTIVLANGGAALVRGVYTLTDFAPDAQGIPLITNPGIPKQALSNDGSYHTVWSFDFVARGYTSGRLIANAVIWSTDSANDAEARLRTVMKCSATPAAGAPAASAMVDILDDGSGPHFDARWFVVGTALCLQIKSLESGTKTYVGIVGSAVGQ